MRSDILNSITADLLSVPPLIFRGIRRRLLKAALLDLEVDISPLHFEIMALLKEAGQEKGFTVDLWQYSNYQSQPNQAAMGYLEAVGIKVNIKDYASNSGHMIKMRNAGKVKHDSISARFAVFRSAVRRPEL